jgi:GT2 family glycosyltransferase
MEAMQMTAPSLGVTRLSVVVCTLNRAELLEGCLQSIARQQVDDHQLEVIVVDNGSTDRTGEVVAARPGTRYVVEPVAGLSRARNAGIAASTGDLLAFLDDDARPDCGWAAAVIDAGARWPDASAFGGPVRLDWTAPPPPWMVPELERWFSAIDHGPVRRLLEPDEHPVGANLVVRPSAALAVGGFDVQLGRVGKSLISEEEIDLLERMRSGGGSVAWEPSATVRHLVDGGRASRRWLIRRAWAQGRSEAISSRLRGRPATCAERIHDLGGAVLGHWPRTIRQVAHADRPAGELLRDVAQRGIRLGRATAFPRRPRPPRPVVGP